ncbi:MAG: segregation/condensation protein A [Verrucomicrobiae bacterium]|nr:segregation/condensation protein A [Verrucomicrobiae bacterium]
MVENDYKVRLEIFEGPLDLLLYLIKKSEVDIYDIPIEKITKQYLEYLQVMRMLSLDIAGEFLVMAATLMLIKSRMLLPAEERNEQQAQDEDVGEEPRWALIRQLVEYKKFKDVASYLGQRAAFQEQVFPRHEASAPELGSGELKLGDVSLFDLINAFNETLKRVAQREDLREIFEETHSVTDKIEEILWTLGERGSVKFHELFDHAATRAEIVATFLALLELIRLKQVRARQDTQFGEIMILKTVA